MRPRKKLINFASRPKLLSSIAKFAPLWCLSLLLARGWQRLFNANLWAEDGTILVADALNLGAPSILLPYAGSYFLIQRFWVLLAVKIFPIAWLAVSIVLFCYCVFAFTATRFCQQRYEWLIPSPVARIFTGFFILLAPGLTEMLGNLANLNWILFFFLVSIAIKDPNDPSSWLEILLGIACLFSIGTGTLLLPLFVWRVWKTESKWWESILPTVIFVSTIMLAFRNDERTSLDVAPIGTQIWILLEKFSQSLFYQPWIGDWPTLWISNGPIALHAALAGVGFILLAIWFFRHRGSRWTQALALLMLGLFFWPLLCWLARPGRFEFFHEELPKVFWRMRYSFPMAVVAILFWMAVLSRRAKPTLLIVFIVLNLIWPIYRFRAGAYGEEARWERWAPKIEEQLRKGCPNALNVPIYPDSWELIVRTKNPC